PATSERVSALAASDEMERREAATAILIAEGNALLIFIMIFLSVGQFPRPPAWAKHAYQCCVPFPEMMVKCCEEVRRGDYRRCIGEVGMHTSPECLGTIRDRHGQLRYDHEVEHEGWNLQWRCRRNGPA